MPPKKAMPPPPSLGGRTPRRSRRTPAPAPVEESSPGPEPERRKAAVSLTSHLDPRPVKFSTAYGSPAFNPGPNERRAPSTVISTDLNAATKRVIDKVQQDNQRDAELRAAEDRAANEAAAQERETEASESDTSKKRKTSSAPAPPARGQKRHKVNPPEPSSPAPNQATTSAPLNRAGSRSRRAIGSSRQGSVPAERLEIRLGEERDREMPDAEEPPTADREMEDPASEAPQGANVPQSDAHAQPIEDGGSAFDALQRPLGAHQGHFPNGPGPGIRVIAEANDDVDLVRPYDDGPPQKTRPETPTELFGALGQRTAGARDLESSVAPTERSFNMESALYQRATVETPAPADNQPFAGPSSPVQRVRSHVPAQPQPPPPQDAPREQTTTTVHQASSSYSWYTEPNHRGVRHSSHSPDARRFVVTNLAVDVADDPVPRHSQTRPTSELENRHLGMAHQGQRPNGLVPPDRPVINRAESPFRPARRSDFPVNGGGLGSSRLAESERFARAQSARPNGLSIPSNKHARSNRAKSAPHEGSAEPRQDARLSEESLPGEQPSARQDARIAETSDDDDGSRGSHAASSLHRRPRRRRPQIDEDHDEDETVHESRESGRSRFFIPGLKNISSWKQAGLYFLLSCLALAIISLVLGPPARELDGHPLDTGIHWYGWDLRRNFGQFIPRSPFQRVILGDDQYSDLLDAWKSHDRAITSLKKADDVSATAVAKLEKVLPKVIRLESDDKGQLVISNEFWLALKDLAVRDADILTLEKRPKRTEKDISEPHWSAVSRRIQDSNLVAPSAVPSPSGLDYESWIRSNDQMVKDILGIDPNGGGIRDEDLKALVEEQTAQSMAQLMLRDDFIRLLREKMQNSQQDVNDKIAQLHENYRDLLDKVSKAPRAESGLTKEEVHGEIRKAVGDLQLEALAKGHISKFWDHGLANRINYFTPKAGAAINPRRCSPSYKPPSQKLKSPDRRTAHTHQPLHQEVVLHRWEDDGDCWSAAATVGGKIGAAAAPADVAVLIERIVPQHIVVEHISPLETVDPGAMPRDMEVWIQVDEYNRRRALVDWSLVNFPQTTTARDPLIDANFVKVAQFTFNNETTLTKSGEAFHFSTQLLVLDAATDQVLVRAQTNYGADHTCFYRLKLYGEPRAMD